MPWSFGATSSPVLRSNVAGPEPNDELDDDHGKDRFMTDSIRKYHDKNVSNVIPKFADRTQAAYQEAEKAEGWKDDDTTIVCYDALLKKSLATCRQAMSIMQTSGGSKNNGQSVPHSGPGC